MDPMVRVTRRDRVRVVFLLVSALAGIAIVHAAGPAKPSIILATTTSTQDSGLLDALIPRFERERRIDVKVIAVGTGAALRMASSGDADVVLVHAPAAEQPLVAAGDLIDGRLVMHNDFIIVGPNDDPGHVREQHSIVAAMRAIARGSLFVSRGDQSGTHIQELQLWQAAGVDPRSLSRREETGQGMGATLSIADQRRAYTLSDRGTFLAQRARLRLVILFQGDPSLRNIYHVYAVNPAKHSGVKVAEARQFIDFLISPAIQRTIAAFKRDHYGESLFFPDAIAAASR
jgi:tungstate transport system substrate-binding protein